MTDTPQPVLHPSLQKLSTAHRRLLRSLGLLIFLTMGGTMLFLMAKALTSQELASLLILGLAGLIILPATALFGGLLWTLERWHQRRLHQANQLLVENQPHAFRLIPVRSVGRVKIFALHPLTTEPLTSDPLHLLVDSSLHVRNAWRSETEMIVQLYCQKLAPGQDLVALQPDGNMLIGKAVILQVIYRQRQRMMVAALIILVILTAILVMLKYT